MLYQIIIVCGLIIFSINLLLNIYFMRKLSIKVKVTDPCPLVSVLIPARNEESNIEACLASLVRQDYPNFEIVVLDDNSTDDTSGIVKKMALDHSRIQLLSGEPLVEGWAGKPFACQQLAQKARGDWLLFVDADTTHTPQMLRSVMSLCLEMKPALLSGFPRQTSNGLPQKIAIPVLYFIILSWLPLWFIQRCKRPLPSLAIGQFLLFHREDYWRMGGHEAVKGRILEDVWLGIEITRRGGRHLIADISEMVSCDMYQSVKQMREGFIRWIYSVATFSLIATIVLLLAACLFYLVPFFWLWRGLTGPTASTLWLFTVILQVVLIFGMRWILDRQLRSPIVASIGHPLGFVFLCICACQAMFRTVFRGGVSWKERTYDRTSAVQ